MIRGKKIVVGSCLNHTPRARLEQWPLYHQYKAVWGCTSWLQHLALSNHSLLFMSILSILAPLFFLLLFESTAERTSELEAGGHGTKSDLIICG